VGGGIGRMKRDKAGRVFYTGRTNTGGHSVSVSQQDHKQLTAPFGLRRGMDRAQGFRAYNGGSAQRSLG
jgi:hypothetical protein